MKTARVLAMPIINIGTLTDPVALVTSEYHAIEGWSLNREVTQLYRVLLAVTGDSTTLKWDFSLLFR